VVAGGNSSFFFLIDVPINKFFYSEKTYLNTHKTISESLGFRVQIPTTLSTNILEVKKYEKKTKYEKTKRTR